MANDYNLETEYGWFVDGIVNFVDENPTEFLEHFGVKGMRWGHRKTDSTAPALTGLGPDRVTRKTKSGDEITLEKIKPNSLVKGMGRLSSKYRDDYNKGANLLIKDSSGKRVGSAVVVKKSDDELYLLWLGIDKGSRGKGYATAAMKTAEAYGKQQGFKKMTLEVPGNSPDARHIYEKMGFKPVKEAKSSNDIWGGLAEMEYTFAEAKHEDTSDLVLMHYGVKGMKWGVRRRRSASVEVDNRSTGKRHKIAYDPKKLSVETDGERKYRLRGSPREAKAFERKLDKAQKVPVKKLTDEELKARVARLQMEKQYKDLSTTTSPVTKGKKIAGDVLTNSGKTAATTVLTAAAVYGLKKGIEKQFGSDTLVEMFPKKKK